MSDFGETRDGLSTRERQQRRFAAEERHKREQPPADIFAVGGPALTDPTFDIRRKQANLCDAVMQRVFDLEAQAAALTEIAKKLRAAVLANT